MSHCPLCKEDASQHAYAGCPLFTGRELLVMVDRAGYIFSSPGVWYSMTMGHLLSFVEGVLAGPFAHLYDLRCNGVLLPNTLPETHLQDLGCCPGGRVDVSLRADALPHQPIHVELINSVVMTACSDCRDEKPLAAAVEVKRRSPPEEPRVAPSSIIPKRCATVGISMHALGSPYQIEVIGTLLERTVHVTQVSVEGRQRDLFNCFAKFGTVLRLRRRNQNIPAHLYTFAFVEFATAAAAQACIAASPLLFVERKMRVEHAKMPITNVDPSDSMPTKAFTAVMEFQHALQDVPAFTEGVHEVVPCVYGAAEARVARLAVFNPLSSDPSSSMTKEPATPTAPGPHRAMPSTTTKRVAPASPIDGQSSGLTSVAPHLSCDTFVDALTERLRQMQAVSALTQLSPTYSRVSHFNNLRAIGAFACFVYAQKPTENAGYRALDSIELALRCLSPIIETAGCIPGNVTDRAMLLSANLTTDALHVAIKVALRLHDAVQTARVALAGDHPGSFGAYINSRAIPTLEAELDASVAIVLLIEEVDPAAAHEMFARLVNTRGRSAPWGVSQSLLLSAARCPIGGLKEALLPGVRDFSLSFLCGNTTFKTFCTVEHALAIANTDFGNADEEAASALAADITGSPSFRAPTSRRVVPRRVDMETSEWV